MRAGYKGEKQETLKPTDNGNFINLPYYKGNSRVLIDFDGRSLNVADALKYAPERVTNGDNLKKFKLLDQIGRASCRERV